MLGVHVYLEVLSELWSSLSDVDDGPAVERESTWKPLYHDVDGRLHVAVHVQRHVTCLGADYDGRPATDQARYRPR